MVVPRIIDLSLRMRRVGLAVVLMAAGPALHGAESSPLISGQPFAARSRPSGVTMFTLMDPVQTGIVTENSYADPKMWAERYEEFALGAIGTGIAAGDYDNDGRPDLFVVSKTGTNRLFRNLGGWKFAEVTAKAGFASAAGGWAETMKGWIGLGSAPAEDVSVWKQGAAWVDINNDGWLDLYVCRYAAPNLLFVNQCDGTFKEEAAARGLAVVSASGMGAFCDFDRDGWLDVYVQTNMLDATAHPDGERDFLFRNNRDGTFSDITVAAGISGMNLAHSATWWDYDEDGWPDIYVANDFGPPDRLYRNNRDGTFTDVIHQVVPSQAYSAMGADLGDIDNDGHVDLFVADMAATTHEKDQRGMASSRALPREGNDDLNRAQQHPRNVLYRNTGLGLMQEVAQLAGLAATDWTWSVRFEDLDNDGRLDLHVTNGMNREYQNADLRERIILAENPAHRLRIMRESPELVEENLAYRNAGNFQFTPIGKEWGLDQTGISFGAAFADFDGDGDLDLIFSNYEAPATILRNDSPDGHRVVVALRGTASNRFGIGATVRVESPRGVQVRPLVVARGYLSSSEPVAHFGLGGDARIDRLVVSWPSGYEQEFTDLAADQRYVVTEPAGPAALDRPAPARAPTRFADESTRRGLALAARERQGEDSNAQPFLPASFARRGPAVAVGDLNGDGREELVLGGTSEDAGRILQADSSGHFTARSAAPMPLDPALPYGPLLLFDADGDNRLDLLVTRAGAALSAGAREYQPRLWLNDGAGGWQAAAASVFPEVSLSAGAAAAADFDRDGHLDVFLGARVQPQRFPRSPRSVLLANRGGRFEDVTDTLAPGLREAGMVTSALWSDVDGDGWLDLLVAYDWGFVRFWRNQGGRGFEDRTESAGFAAAGRGWWTALGSADFNGDGQPDYAAGNVGLNTPYRASVERPATLFYGDFAGGPLLLLEAFYEGDRLFPVRSRKELGAKISSILRRFPKNDDFARATLEDLVTRPRLDRAERFTATQFAHGVFLSQPGGGYRFSPLPRIAQIAPVQGLVAGDFTGDGRADLYAVQNSFAPNPTVGRFAAGLSQLLAGRAGEGGFEFVAVEPASSGLVVRGDAKALVTLDLDDDGRPDFFGTRNSQTSFAFRHQGVADRGGALRVSLRGPAGNPTAVGARVTCELSNGTTQTQEVAAGSGYWSQSSAACFFGVPEGKAPRRVTVRWPAGATSVHEVPANSRTLTVSAQ